MIPGEPFAWHRLYRRVTAWSPWSGDQPQDLQVGWIWTQEYSVADLTGILQFCSVTGGADPYSIQGALGAPEVATWYILWRRWPPSAFFPPYVLQAWVHTTPSEARALGKVLASCAAHPSAKDLLLTDQQNHKVT